MKKWIKILIAIIATPVVLIAVFLLSYVIINQQGVIEPFQVGSNNAKNRILIASQGSEFKNNLVDKIIVQLEGNQNYLSIIDVSALGNENDKDWNAIIIIHTLQVHEMPEQAHLFLSETEDLSKVMLVSTSGAGDDKVEGFNVDAISSASRDTAISVILKWISKNLDENTGVNMFSSKND